MINVQTQVSLTRCLALSAVLAVAALSSCGEEAGKKPQPEGATVTQGPPPRPRPQLPKVPFEVDTADGQMTIKGFGVEESEWKFRDVTAVLEERAVAGVTRNVLTIEAHDAETNRHFRLRLLRDGGLVDAGIYSIEKPSGDPPRKLEARWESGGAMYNSATAGTGTVELAKVDDARATGRFELHLSAVGRADAKQTLRGSFNQSLRQ